MDFRGCLMLLCQVLLLLLHGVQVSAGPCESVMPPLQFTLARLLPHVQLLNGGRHLVRVPNALLNLDHALVVSELLVNVLQQLFRKCILGVVNLPAAHLIFDVLAALGPLLLVPESGVPRIPQPIGCDLVSLRNHQRGLGLGLVHPPRQLVLHRLDGCAAVRILEARQLRTVLENDVTDVLHKLEALLYMVHWELEGVQLVGPMGQDIHIFFEHSRPLPQHVLEEAVHRLVERTPLHQVGCPFDTQVVSFDVWTIDLVLAQQQLQLLVRFSGRDHNISNVDIVCQRCVLNSPQGIGTCDGVELLFRQAVLVLAGVVTHCELAFHTPWNDRFGLFRDRLKRIVIISHLCVHYGIHILLSEFFTLENGLFG
mmetsp:Transcript_130264/g.225212  ORF Transcript_130264/g.225212 Transcript_130264/m.225212 type:complete len:369 (-) Transcript_130264:131-1237(-)